MCVCCFTGVAHGHRVGEVIKVGGYWTKMVKVLISVDFC